MHKKIVDVLEVNQTFYEAFAAGDIKALEALWLKSDEVSVIHPGSSALHGYKDVMMSWQQILENSGGSGIHCANPKVYLHGDMAYVVCYELFPEGDLIATNIFALENDHWYMVHHQAGPDNQLSREVSNHTEFVH